VAGSLLITPIWGGTFAIMKYALQGGMSVGAMLSLRFSLGALGLALLVLLLRVPLRRRDLLDGVLLGLPLTAVFWLQTDGLRHTTSSKSAFITGLYVLFTPLISAVLGHRPRLAHGLGALAAVFGLYLLVHVPGAPMGGWNLGDTETLICAVGCGLHIVLTGKFSRRSSGWLLALGQVTVVAVLSILATCLLPAPYGFQGLPSILARPPVWITLGYLSLLATVLAFYLMATFQGHLGNTEAAIIYSLEPVMAALLAMSGWVPGVRDHLTATQLAGGGVILGAMLLAELGPRWLGRPDPILHPPT
jgi:drug/metabolite transporter (DMT)-like permease